MRANIIVAVAFLLAIALPVTAQESGHIVVGASDSAAYSDLQAAIDEAPDGAIIVIEPGSYSAISTPFEEYQCGNCLDPATTVRASTGFVVRGKSLTISGMGSNSTELVTNAGYGIYVEDCPKVEIFDLAITGGTRDQDGSATCAGVVVRRSSVEIARCEIHDNQGDFSVTVAGVGGVMGREGAILHIHHNRIHDNSWDGVALYRGAVAQIHDNEIWNGRGAGVGITWDAEAVVIRNDIHDYWKGIGSFGNTRVGAYNNFVHDLAGWGIIATGTSDMICRNNTVIRCGNVGIAGWSEEARMEIVNNIIAFNGGQEQWVAPRVGIWMNCIEGNYKIAYNNICGNHDAAVAFGYQEFEDGTWSYLEEREFIGVDGNIADDPLLQDESSEIGPDSPCIDAGDPETLDPDNTQSDIGATGGSYAQI
jgi:hypothetical protein